MNYVCLEKLPGAVFFHLKPFLKFWIGVLFLTICSIQLQAQCEIECRDTTLLCAADYNAFIIGNPPVTGCTGLVVYSFTNNIVNLGCNDPAGNYARVERTWVVADDLGSTDTCVQNIFIMKGELSDVELVPSVTRFCENASRPPTQNLFPEIDGFPLDGRNICNLSAEITTQSKFDSCDVNIFKFSRVWTIRDQCTGDSVLLNQVNAFVDTMPPTVICPDTLRFETETGFCHGDIQVPDPVYVNNCTATERLFIDITGVGFNLNSYDDIPKGQYELIYKGTDCSLDTGECKTVLLIEDTETPTAVCREFTVVSLTSMPYVDVPAISFDEGSYDNCDNVGFLASRNGLDFSEMVRFDCMDLGMDSIMVVLQVFEKNNPNQFDRCMAFVKLNDKLAPNINCPANRTINCGDDYSDLSIFGEATAVDACGFLITEIVVEDITGCGAGTINRTFTARDSSGNSNSCSQTIFINNLTPYSVSNIIFPIDTIFRECNPETHPDSLPQSYSRPEFIGGDSCAMLFVNYSDERFDVSFPACFKILRTWRVLEMCSGTEFTHIQELKVMDNTQPDLICPPDMVVAADYDCSDTPVILPNATSTDCDPNVQLSWISSIGTGQNGNASGNYPNGTTIVEFKAKDRCGNVSTCQTSVEVTDLSPPTVKAHKTISIELGIAGALVSAKLDAEAINANSKDNCSVPGNLKYFLRRHSVPVQGIPGTESIIYDCDDIGIDSVEFWVEDEAGNSDYVIVLVEVQDNFNRCPGSRTAKLSGFLKTEDNQPLADIAVHLKGEIAELTYTDSLGFYQFNNLPVGKDYTVAPFKNDDAPEGVSTFDLVLLSRHILNVEQLNSPYKMVAADANKSASVSTTDLVALRKVILRTANEFPTNTTWRFLDKSYQFREPKKPLGENLPPERVISDLQSDISEIDFVGIKIGDLNGTISEQIQNRTSEEEFKVEFQIEEDVIWIKNIEKEEMEGLQFSVSLGGTEIKDLEIIPGVISDFSKNHSSVFEGNNIMISWNGNSVSAEAGSRLFGLKFKHSNTANPEITKVLNPEVYTEGMIRKLEITERNDSEAEPEFVYELLQNKPNPFKQSTIIAFRLPEPTKAKVTIFDLAGNIVKVVTGEFEKGLHQVRLNKNELESAGVYFYKLETPRFTSTKKMILL